MKYLLSIFLSLHTFLVSAEEFSLKWSITVTNLDTIKLIDGGEYRVSKAEGSWEDSNGYYGYLKCIGPVMIDSKRNLILDLICDGYDNKEEKFEINLKRNSIEDAGIGKAIYINGTGRYIDFVDKTCTYAVNYLNSKVGFYKQICKN